MQLTTFDLSCFTLTPCCDSYEVRRSSNTIGIQLQMIQCIIRTKPWSKDTPSFQRRDWLKRWRIQWGWNTMQYEQNQIWWMWMRGTMISKINEMEMNDEVNELNFGTRNEWNELWYTRWMRWKWLGKYVTNMSPGLMRRDSGGLANETYFFEAIA